MPDNTPATELAKLIEARGDGPFYSAKFITLSANWVSDHATQLLAEREKDRARIERFEEEKAAAEALLKDCRDGVGCQPGYIRSITLERIDAYLSRAALADGGK